jgi:hypothetical protein
MNKANYDFRKQELFPSFVNSTETAKHGHLDKFEYRKKVFIIFANILNQHFVAKLLPMQPAS